MASVRPPPPVREPMSPPAPEDGDASGPRGEPALAPIVGLAPSPPQAEQRPRASREQMARELVDVLRKELRAASVPALRAGRMHYECGRLEEYPLGDLAQAADSYLTAHGLLKDHLPSVRGARRALIGLGRTEEAAKLLDTEIALTSEPEGKAELYYQKGILLEDALDRRKEAREAFERATELDPTGITRNRAAMRAELLAGAWEGLEKSLAREVNTITSDARHRAAVLVARARLVEVRRNDPASATELYGLALETDQENESAMHALKRLHHAQKRFRDLIQVLEREAALAPEPTGRALCLYMVGRLHLDRLGSIADGVAALTRASREAPGNAMILEALAWAYQASHQPSELCKVLSELSELSTSDAEKLTYAVSVADLYRSKLGDEEQAMVWYERARALDPTSPPVLQALSALYESRQEHARLIEVLASEVEHRSEPERRAAALARIAEIYERRLGRKDEALSHHARALGILPGYAPSFKAAVRLLSEAHRFRELVELYQRAVDGAREVETKVAYLYKIGRVLEDALGSFAEAAATYRRIVEIAPRELGAIHALQRAAERAELPEELLAALGREVDLSADPREKLELLVRKAEVAERLLGDDARAVDSLKRALSLDASHAAAHAALGRLYYKLGRWEDLLENYRHEASRLKPGPSLSALLFKMAELAEQRLGQEPEALELCRRAVAADPGNHAAARALEHKLAERASWAELTDLLASELSLVDGPEARARLHLRIGEIQESRLGALPAALQAYEQALAADPGLVIARDGKIRILTQEKDHPALVQVLEKGALGELDSRLAIAALLRAGELRRDELGQPIKATQDFEEVLKRDPTQLEALLALEALYAEQGNASALAAVYATEAKVLTDPMARAAALRELGRLHASGKVESDDRGKQTFSSLLELLPSDLGALQELERLALQQDDVELLGHVEAKLVAAPSADPASLASHETRLGELLEALQDPAALSLYRAALKHEPEAFGAARGLSRLAEALGDPGLLEEAAAHEARLSMEPGRAAGLLVTAARTCLGAGDLERAVGLLGKALEVEPEHPDAAQDLKQCLLSRREIDRLLAAFTRAVGAASSPERIAELWTEIGELQAEHKGDLPAALAALERARSARPKSVLILLRLAELCQRDGQWERAVEHLSAALEHAPDPATAQDVNLKLAVVVHEKLGDPERALGFLKAVLAATPDHLGALQELAALELDRGDPERAAATGERWVRHAKHPEDRVAALTFLARLEKQRDNLERSARAYEQAIAIVGVGGVPATEMRDLVAHARGVEGVSFERYVAALEKHVEENPEARPEVFSELAGTLAEPMQKLERSRTWLERGLKAHPEALDLRLQLSRLELGQARYQEALAELHQVVGSDVHRAEAWRLIAQALREMQRGDEALLALGPLLSLGQATDAERATYSVRSPRTAAVAPGSFGSEEFSAIAVHSGEDTAARLLVSLWDLIERIYPADLQRFGVSPKDRLGARSAHPIRLLTDRLADVFSLGDLDLWLFDSQRSLVRIEPTDPPTLLVPSHVVELREPEQAFLIARALASLARRLGALEFLDAADLGLVLAAGARLADPAFEARGIDEEALPGVARRLSKALPWLGRGPIEEAARAYADAPPVDVADWVFSARLHSARAASILADDLPTTLALVRRLEGDLSGRTGSVLSDGRRLAEDLMRFWISEPAFFVRRRIGLV